ncbi:MAG: class I SAM-dependent methyltransferase [Eubacteriaceae bacterium]|nr:class I SAM-dependent methyltransferase [Eubacteriaceae bacterium]
MSIYKHFSEFYDSYIAQYDYSLWFSYLCMLSGYDSFSGKRVLDLGCGTGSMLARFASEGAIAIGVDISEDMLEKAYSKLFPKHSSAMIVNADISDVVFSYKIDFAYSMGDTVNYLNNEQMAKLLENVYTMLAEGSAFTFDIINTEFLNDGRMDETVFTELGSIRFERKINESQSAVFTQVHLPSLANCEDLVEEHIQYLHTPDSLTVLAQEAGFRSCCFYDIFSTELYTKNSEKIQGLLRK